MGHDAAMRAYYDAELGTRTGPPSASPRGRHVREFVGACRERHLRSVLEVGCGGGHDGRVLQAGGLDHTGVDLSAAGVQPCAGLGLRAVQASAVALPFIDASFDAGWTMSTLMHLPGDDLALALAELGRVLRPGGLLEVGVWGADEDGTRIDEHGRYFRHRTDDQLRDLLATVGQVVAFETWDRRPGGGHYQRARVQVRASG